MTDAPDGDPKEAVDRDSPIETAAPAPPASGGQVPWPVTLGVTWAFGALSGVVITYALGIVPLVEFHPSPAPPPRVTVSDPVVANTGATGGENTRAGGVVEAGEGAADSGSRRTPLETPDPRTIASDTNDPADAAIVEPASETFSAIPTKDLHDLLGPAVLSLRAEDDEGDALPSSPAPMLSDGRALIPVAGLRGAVSAVLVGSSGERLTVTGVVAQDTTIGVALLELAAPPTDRAFIDLRTAPLSGPTLVRLLGSNDKATEHEVTPGAMEPQSRAPRLRLSPQADQAGVLVDENGSLIGIVPKPGAFAIDTHLAGNWADRSGAVALDVFQRTMGPGTGKDRLQRARKLVSQRRFDEATREFLVLTVEDPSLLPEVRDEFENACVEATRPMLAGGQWQTATPLLIEVLTRITDASTLWASLGRSHAMSGNLRLAIESFLAAADHEPAERSVHIAEARGLLLEEAAALEARGRAVDSINLLTDLRGSFPDDGELRVTLGELLMRMRRFREAANMFFEAATADPRAATSARRRGEHARDLAGGPGTIAIDYPVGARDITLLVRVEGSTSVTLLLDDAEELVVLPPAIAARAGHKINAVPRVRYLDDPNAEEVPSITLGTITAMGVGTQGVQAVLMDGYGGAGAAGVLGRSFLSRFRRVQDEGLGRLVLYPR